VKRVCIIVFLFTLFYSSNTLGRRSKTYLDLDLGYGRYSQKTLDIYQTDLKGPLIGIGIFRRLSPTFYLGVSLHAHRFKQNVVIDGRQDQLKQSNYIASIYGKRFFSPSSRFFLLGKMNYSFKKYSLDEPRLEEIEPAAKTVYGLEDDKELGISYGMGIKLFKLDRRRQARSYMESKFYRTDYLSSKSNDLTLSLSYVRRI